MPIAVIGEDVVVDGVEVRRGPATELQVPGLDARVDDVHVHPGAGRAVVVGAVQRPFDLIDAVQAPGGVGLRRVDGDLAILHHIVDLGPRSEGARWSEGAEGRCRVPRQWMRAERQSGVTQLPRIPGSAGGVSVGGQDSDRSGKEQRLPRESMQGISPSEGGIRTSPGLALAPDPPPPCPPRRPFHHAEQPCLRGSPRERIVKLPSNSLIRSPSPRSYARPPARCSPPSP
jgi:hypothetical protein